MKFPVASPYNVIESMYWLKKYMTGFSADYAGIVKNIPQCAILNENIPPEYTLAFVGDIMPTAQRSLGMSESLHEFFKGCDYFVGNLEGNIIRSDKRSVIPASDRRHGKEIMEILGGFFSPANTYLSVANNHAGDYGEEEFFQSVKMLETHNFNVFGSKLRPFCDINKDVRIVSGTMWSNRQNKHVSWLKDAHRHLKPGAFNILYPHFGYEFELYPRPGILKLAQELLSVFDAIIGQHAHCPQPISCESVKGTNRLLAHSLGDFLDIRNKMLYQYGMTVKMKIGRDESGKWLVGQVDWRLTKCAPLLNGKIVVDTTEDNLFEN